LSMELVDNGLSTLVRPGGKNIWKSLGKLTSDYIIQ